MNKHYIPNITNPQIVIHIPLLFMLKHTQTEAAVLKFKIPNPFKAADVLKSNSCLYMDVCMCVY